MACLAGRLQQTCASGEYHVDMQDKLSSEIFGRHSGAAGR